MNSVHIIGRLTKDPEVRYTQSGKAFARFTLAVDRRGGKDKGADFIPCQAWDKLAETIGDYTQKGSKIAVEGRIQTGSYEKNGQKTYTVDYLTKKTKVNEGEIPQYYVEGDHEAIIDPAVFDRVQIELEKRCSGKNRHSGVHDFSGKIKCGQCGSWYGSKVWHSTDKYRKVIWRCNHKYGGEKCSTPHLTEDEIKAAFVRAANKALADKDTVIETFRLIRDSVFDTSALEQERTELTDELNIVAGLIQDGIYQNAHVAQNQADYNKEYETLTARYEKAKSRLDEVEAEIHDKNSRRKSIEHYLALLEERKDAVTEYETYLWHGMVEFVTVYSKDDIRFTMKDGTEIRV